MSLTKSLLVYVFLGLLGAVGYFSLYRDYSPLASVDLQYTRAEIIEKGRRFLADMDYDTEGLTADANLQFRSTLALYLEARLGLERAHEVMRSDSLESHRWDVYLFDRNLARSQMPHRYNVWISPKGKIWGFQHLMHDSIAAPSVGEEEALELTRAFLSSHGVDLARYTLKKSTLNQLPNRTDHFFEWARKDAVFGMDAQLWAQVKGDKIGGFGYDVDLPKDFQSASSDANTFVSFVITAASVATFLLLIFVITLFLKKYHEGEVGTKTALVVFAFLFSVTLVEHLLGFTALGYTARMGDLNRFYTRIAFFFVWVFIVHAFLAATAFAAWSVGESSARSGWGTKMSAIDGWLQRKPFTLHFGSSVIRGYSLGFLLLGIIFGSIVFLSQHTNIWMFTMGLNGIPESKFPSMSAAFLGLRVAILNEIVFRFFFISWLRERTGKVWPGILISSLLWTLIAFTLWDFPPGYINFTWLFPAYFLISVILGVILVKTDLLTVIFTNWILLAFTYAVPMLTASGGYFQTQSLIFYGVMAAPVVMAIISFIKRQRVSFSPELMPSHIRRITERERMAKELEIARNVQMSLLPKQNPLVEGYDIAGVCIPALEVGGDYYDFFQLGDNEIGIAIGDVSGKGVPAAIYMTLTKGILQSHATETISPREVLNKLNKQMYFNIERNSFVSMFYAVLDMKEHKLRFARAGHNPAILAHREHASNTLLEPKGIALGLEAGDRFYAFLEEHEITLQSGDVLTFYTDGFTEASTEKGAEFGEERLEQIISDNKNASANVIIQNVVRSVKKFVGNHPQHDDMTMVVVKVL